MSPVKFRGFTLIEILIALFVFSILGLLLSGALHNVINIQSGTERSSERLRQLQFALLLFSRDIEQTVNRPVLNGDGRQDAAFIGTANSVTFTHGGIATSPDNLARSNMQRSQYTFYDNAFWRNTWVALDQPPKAQPRKRILLQQVTAGHFEYLDNKNRAYNSWPLPGQTNTQPLPKAVRIYLTISNWGAMTQLYVIPIQSTSPHQ